MRRMRYQKNPSPQQCQDFRDEGPAPHGSIASRAKRAMADWMRTLPEDERAQLTRRLPNDVFDPRRQLARAKRQS